MEDLKWRVARTKKNRVQTEPQILQKIIQRDPELLPMLSDSQYDQPTGTQNQTRTEYDRQLWYTKVVRGMYNSFDDSMQPGWFPLCKLQLLDVQLN